MECTLDTTRNVEISLVERVGLGNMAALRVMGEVLNFLPALEKEEVNAYLKDLRRDSQGRMA